MFRFEERVGGVNGCVKDRRVILETAADEADWIDVQAIRAVAQTGAPLLYT